MGDFIIKLEYSADVEGSIVSRTNNDENMYAMWCIKDSIRRTAPQREDPGAEEQQDSEFLEEFRVSFLMDFETVLFSCHYRWYLVFSLLNIDDTGHLVFCRQRCLV